MLPNIIPITSDNRAVVIDTEPIIIHMNLNVIRDSNSLRSDLVTNSPFNVGDLCKTHRHSRESRNL